jgi:hypothetical protein
MIDKIINFPQSKDTVSIPAKTHTVWVGGTEVNSYFLTKSEAVALATVFIEDGYNDVCVFNIGVKDD